MLRYTVRPLTHWPRESTRNRKRSRFGAKWTNTLDLLESELRHLRASDVVLMVDADERCIRNDGRLRSDAKLGSPRVILAFETPNGSMQFPCDRFANWDCNVRAIALALESLRRVDRYGVTSTGEQYTGWKRLPGDGSPQQAMSKEAAAERLASLSGMGGVTAAGILQSPELAGYAYKQACRRSHPDAADGSAELFREVQALKSMLG